MIQKLRLPCSKYLRQIINFFSYVEFEENDTSEDWMSIFPNATTNMAICLGDKMYFPAGHSDNGVSVVCTSVANLKVTSKLRFVTVQFNSFGLYAFWRIPMHQLFNSHFDLDMLFKPSECERIKDRLASSPNISTIFETLEFFLTKRVKNIQIDPRLPYSIALLCKNDFSMDEVSDKICLSSRGFRKLFSNQIGFSPSYYKKIARFNRAATNISASTEFSLTAIALKHGYYDQSHFIKDFKQFAGISPSTYQKIMADSTDFYNYKSTDPVNLG